MKCILLASIFLCSLILPTGLALAEDKNATEIQAIKPELAKANVTSAVLKSGEVLAVAELPHSDDQDDSLNVEFYFKPKNDAKWTFLDRLQLDKSSFEFRADGVIKISIEEGGTSTSTTTSLWRLEKESLKVIGQDSEIAEGWALDSKTDPYRTKTSTNFLNGRKTVVSEFSHAKTKKIECKFDKQKFETQKISEMNSGGAKEPECPDTQKLNKATRNLNGNWKLVEVGCVGNDLTTNGLVQNQALKKDQYSVLLNLEDGKATYKIKLYDAQNPSWDCTVTRTETWHLEGGKLTVRATVENYSGAGSDKVKCAQHNAIPEAREHILKVGNKMELQLTGNIPDSGPRQLTCETSIEKLIYFRAR